MRRGGSRGDEDMMMTLIIIYSSPLAPRARRGPAEGLARVARGSLSLLMWDRALRGSRGRVGERGGPWRCRASCLAAWADRRVGPPS